jgi:3D (Asp-Asp-Asp) domain-containing protein
VSNTSTVRLGRFAAGVAVTSLMALAPALARTPKQTDSHRSVNAARPDDTHVPASRSITQREPIPYPTQRKATSQLRSGTSRTVQNGRNGEKEVVYRVYSNPDGVELRREKISEKILKKPVAEIREEGRQTSLPSRGYFSGRRIVTMSATTYDPYNCGGSGEGITATGLKAGYGVVAVDPKFIPLGTKLFIEGYGYAVAADTGGAIKGNRIDLCIDSKHDASGVKNMKAVRVHILD